ncbi:hypothetical protein F2Q70_00030635 [Brassica cretica]|uniref:Uncharacterized protein n=1 Tax=Brassica cretica TaxID=69181 RepID=A0A8S9FFT0_BRACR|nr:hypothetical protein F2Q70_00030635 [Brassica cretica]
MDNFLPFSSSNANSVQELSMDLNKNRSHFSMAQPQHLLPPYSYVACPVLDQTGAMNHQPLHSSDAFPQIPVVQTGGEFGYLICKPCVRQERGGFLDPHSTKMARINRKKAMIRSRNNSNPNSSSNELVDSRRQVALTMKNNAEIAARKDFYRFSSFDNKKLRVLLVKHLKNSDVGSLGRIVLPKTRVINFIQKDTGEMFPKWEFDVEDPLAENIIKLMFVKKPWKWTMDCWEVTGTWVNTKPAVVSPAKKKVVKEDSPRPRKKARKEAPAEAREEAAAEASEEAAA